jgi:hypothetical protein
MANHLLPVGVESKHIEPLTKWKDKAGMMAHRRPKGLEPIVNNIAKTKSEEVIKREYSAVIGKVAIDNLELTRTEFLQAVANGDTKLTHEQYSYMAMANLNSVTKVIEEMLAKEGKKKRKNDKILKWCVNKLIEVGKDLMPEMRKANFELDEMKNGKKRVNLNANMGKVDMKDWLEAKPENVIDAEVVNDSSEGNTDKE